MMRAQELVPAFHASLEGFAGLTDDTVSGENEWNSECFEFWKDPEVCKDLD